MRPKSATYAPIKRDDSHFLLFHVMGIPSPRDATSFLQHCVTTRITTILCFHSYNWSPPTKHGASKSTNNKCRSRLDLQSIFRFLFSQIFWNLVFCLILITLQAITVEQPFHDRVKRNRVPSVLICLKSYFTLIGWELFPAKDSSILSRSPSTFNF